MTPSISWPRILAEGLVVGAGIVLMACSDPAPVGPPEWPFDPSGVWEGDLQGRLRGDSTSATLVLSLVDDRAWCSSCLSGTWEWAGLDGEADVYWNYDGSPQCDATPGVYCPFGIVLYPPPPGACSEPPGIPGGGQGLIHVRAMFEGQARLVAPEVKGTFWEGAPSDGWPCPGPELLSFDTQMDLVLR